MKILKSGKNKKPKAVIAECHCGCRFSFTKDEARYESYPRNESAYVVKCPECRADIWVDPSLVD